MAQALAKYAFGLGSLQMLATTAAFTLFALPVGAGVGTQILVKLFHVSPELASIRSVDEAIVIGAALSLSSSAFVLQLLGESGDMGTRVGSATLGILLFQVCSRVYRAHASCWPVSSRAPGPCTAALLHCRLWWALWVRYQQGHVIAWPCC